MSQETEKERGANRVFQQITEPFNEIACDIRDVVENERKERYFEAVLIMHMLIENMLKWLVLTKIAWSKEKAGEIGEEEWGVLQAFCKKTSFDRAVKMALAMSVVSWPLYQELDALRGERNDMVHQFWVYTHRNDHNLLKKEIERLSFLGKELVSTYNSLLSEIGVQEVFEIFL
jgi:hypothetical protein